jgi:hypothetical protein
VYGTDIADQLRASKFMGLILLRSGNADDAACAIYQKSGAVDGCFDKSDSNKQLAESIRKMYADKIFREVQDLSKILGKSSTPAKKPSLLNGRKMLAIDDSEVDSKYFYTCLCVTTCMKPFDFCSQTHLVGSFFILHHQMICKGYSRIIFPILDVDVSESQVVCPTSRRDVDLFIENALGRSQDGRLADVILLDQNMHLPEAGVRL